MVFQLYLFSSCHAPFERSIFLNKWSLWEVALEKELAKKWHVQFCDVLNSRSSDMHVFSLFQHCCQSSLKMQNVHKSIKWNQFREWFITYTILSAVHNKSIHLVLSAALNKSIRFVRVAAETVWIGHILTVSCYSFCFSVMPVHFVPFILFFYWLSVASFLF